MKDKILKLKEKLKLANVQFEEFKSESTDSYSKIKFEVFAGREKNECLLIYTEKYLDYALGCDFEKFKFVQGYEAIWSKDNNLIEAEITSPEANRFNFLERLNNLINKPEDNENEEFDDDILDIMLPNHQGLEISLGYCSQPFSLITGSRERGLRRFNSKKITLKITNSKKTTHDSSRDLLEKIANSIFFQIDLAFEIPISLQSQRETYIETRIKRKRKLMFIDKDATISEPKYEYDTEPISLYWYAKESSNMPIFQYLAFYQTLEFYFPIYSSYEAKQKIQSIIKDPRFNPNKDNDITKIISTIKSSSNGKSFGNEREQLKATISACTNNIELRSFFEADENRKIFFTENKGKPLISQKISLKNETTDLVAEVSERIYQLRCRIVHSKGSEADTDVLLPYSVEVKNLNFDIELVEFISRKVLITSSRPIAI
ncbi:hypothetical protein ACQKCJ_08780 [Flavobacterium sp. NPDC079362]|uniref:hypothetical protein n=1 Tax=Flavobacterium sp. NPDC079362 TaxID=3390566 RepID=UPI003D03C02C